MQVLIFALLALAVGAENYHSYYNPYSSYGHYGGYGLGYGSSLYGHSYGLGDAHYNLGGHYGHYAYQPAKYGTLQTFGINPFQSGFGSVEAPGRISFTLGAAGATGKTGVHSLGTNPGFASAGKTSFSAISKDRIAQVHSTGTVANKFGTAGPGRISFTLGSSALSGQSNIHSQRPEIFGKFPSPAVLKTQSHIQEPFQGKKTESFAGPGRISFTLGSSAVSEHSGIQTQGKRPEATSSGKLPSPAISSTGTSSEAHGSSQTSRPGHISFVQDHSRQPGHSTDKFFAPAFPKDKKTHAAAKTGSTPSSQEEFHSPAISSPKISEEGVKPSKDVSPVSVPNSDSVFSIEPNYPEYPSIFDGGNSAGKSGKSPVFVAIPADSLEDSPISKHSFAVDLKDTKSGDSSFDSHSTFDDKSSNQPSSEAEAVDGMPAFYKQFSFAAKEPVTDKESTHKYSPVSKESGIGNASPLFVPVPEDSLADEKSFKLSGNPAADKRSAFKFSSTVPSYGPISQFELPHGQSSYAYESPYNYEIVSSPVKSFTSKPYAGYGYVPFSPLFPTAVQMSSLPFASPFYYPQNYEVVGINKK